MGGSAHEHAGTNPHLPKTPLQRACPHNLSKATVESGFDPYSSCTPALHTQQKEQKVARPARPSPSRRRVWPRHRAHSTV
eukprot:10919-Eustigmatos_ZCMA.PRE.1